MKRNIIILFLVLTVVFGVLYFSKNVLTPDATVDVLSSFSSWKSYDGKSKIDLNLKYPANWTVDDVFPDFVSFLPMEGNGFNVYRVKAVDKKQTLTQWLKAKDKENKEAMGGQYNDYVISSKKTKVAKLSAVRRVEYADAAGFSFIQTYVKSGNYFYSFGLQISLYGDYSSEDEKIYNKILSTVKFTK